MGFKKTVSLSFLMLGSLCSLGTQGEASWSRISIMSDHPRFRAPSTVDERTALNPVLIPGSLAIEDDWNVFLNPALIHSHRGLFSVNASPKSRIHGGGLYGWESFVFGLYLNREQDLSVGQPGAHFYGFKNVDGKSAARDARWPAEVFVGGDLGVKWGVKASWAGGSTADISVNDFRLGYGIELIGVEIFGESTLSSSYEDERKLSVKQNFESHIFGLKMTWAGFHPYFSYHAQNESMNGNAFSQSVGSNVKVYSAGLAYDYVLMDGLHLHPQLGFWMGDLKDTSDTSRNGFARGEWKQYVLPLNLAAEYEAYSWLMLRAGLSYDALNSYVKKEGTAQNNTEKTFSDRQGVSPRIGLGLKQKEFSLDFGAGRSAADERFFSTLTVAYSI